MNKLSLCVCTLLFFLGSIENIIAQQEKTGLDYSLSSPGKQRSRTWNIDLEMAYPLERSFQKIIQIGYNFNSFSNTNKNQFSQKLNVAAGVAEGLGNYLNASYSFSNRFYPYKNLFIPIEVDASISLNPTDFVSINRSFKIGLGIGKINIVNETEIAERLIDKLAENVMNQENKKRTIAKVANVIRVLRNQRQTSNRSDVTSEIELIRIKLEELDLISKHLSSEQVNKIIMNHCAYEPLVSRKNGWTAALMMGINNIDNFSNDPVNSRFKTQDKYPSLVAEYQKYINPKFQFSIKMNAGLSRQIDVLHTWSSYKATSKSDILSLSTRLDYLPDIDTRWSFVLSGMYTQYSIYNFRGDFDIDKYKSIEGFDFNLNIGYEKRLRRNLRISADLNVGYTQLNGFRLMPSAKIRF